MAQTYCGMTQAAIALERFKLREHKLPAVLEDLTPAYLSSVPIDRMDGKPLRYTPFSDGSYLLYSVGLNGKDDGGNANSKQAGGFVGLDWHAPDAVWPTLATDDEIKKSRVVRE
jgi:hypothetical protein